MNEIKEYTEKLFDDIKHINENGEEYWFARELMPLLEYSKWENFNNVINKTYKDISKQMQTSLSTLKKIF